MGSFWVVRVLWFRIIIELGLLEEGVEHVIRSRKLAVPLCQLSNQPLNGWKFWLPLRHSMLEGIRDYRTVSGSMAMPKFNNL